MAISALKQKQFSAIKCSCLPPWWLEHHFCCFIQYMASSIYETLAIIFFNCFVEFCVKDSILTKIFSPSFSFPCLIEYLVCNVFW